MSSEDVPPQIERCHLEIAAADQLTEVPGFAKLPAAFRLECYARMGRLLALVRRDGRREVLTWLRENGGDPADYSSNDVGQYLADHYEQSVKKENGR